MRRGSSSVTIREVAARAGVSIATVSRVLSGDPRFRPATAERVLKAAREIDYRPSEVARSLKRGATRQIGLLVPDVENPFYAEIVRSVEYAALDRGYVVVLCNTSSDPAREAVYVNLLADRWVDGVVVAGSHVGSHDHRWVTSIAVPVVLVNTEPPSAMIPAVLPDNYTGGRLVAEHLISLGHRRIGRISVNAPPSGDLRLLGISEALARSAFPWEAQSQTVSDGYPNGGERAMHELLAIAPSLTAVICYNDLTAIGALRALHALGRRVPEEISVVGFDDIQMASFVEPPLTTIALQKNEMAEWAVQAVIEAINSGRRRRKRMVPTRLPVRLVVRHSTGPAPT